MNKVSRWIARSLKQFTVDVENWGKDAPQYGLIFVKTLDLPTPDGIKSGKKPIFSRLRQHHFQVICKKTSESPRAAVRWLTYKRNGNGPVTKPWGRQKERRRFGPYKTDLRGTTFSNLTYSHRRWKLSVNPVEGVTGLCVVELNQIGCVFVKPMALNIDIVAGVN